MEVIRKKQKIINDQIVQLKKAPIYRQGDLAIKLLDLQVDLQNELINKIEILEGK